MYICMYIYDESVGIIQKTTYVYIYIYIHSFIYIHAYLLYKYERWSLPFSPTARFTTNPRAPPRESWAVPWAPRRGWCVGTARGPRMRDARCVPDGVMVKLDDLIKSNLMIIIKIVVEWWFNVIQCTRWILIYNNRMVKLYIVWSWWINCIVGRHLEGDKP